MKQQPSRFWIVSVAIHVALFVVIGHSLTMPGGLEQWLRNAPRQEMPAERIGFLALPRAAEPVPGRSGGDGRPVAPEAPLAEPIVAPQEVPVGIPPAPDEGVPAPAATGSGALVGRGGPTQGIVPRFDSPLWAPVSPELIAPRSSAEEIREGIAARVWEQNDSLRRAQPTGRAPGDWTVTRGDTKIGIDQQKIYLGPIEIPTAVLALLPINLQANPQALDRQRALSLQAADIRHHAQRAVTNEEFREAVKRIRERKERERRKTQEQVGPVAEPDDSR
ncbi:MAG TPA: hypothetical protein VMM77_06895 [Gemmatimonadaceae bacterium]|nr:hypothetical protein [Gemmatimonadaceae bacterium]